MVVRVALDTSFLIFIVRRRISLDAVQVLFAEPVLYYTSRGVINELEHISKSSKAISKHATLALKLISKRTIAIIEDSNTPDDWLLTQDVIATVDINLIRAAKAKPPKTIITVSKANRIIKTNCH